MKLTNLTKKHGEKFTKDIIEFLNEYGWDSYSKKEIKLFLFFLAQKYEYITTDKVNLEFANKMKMTKRRLKNVLIESQLHFGNISSDAINILSALFENNETTYNDLKEGEFRFNIRNPILNEQVIDLLEENKMTPDFKTNRSILFMDIISIINYIKNKRDLKESEILNEIAKNLDKETTISYNEYIDNFDKSEITFSKAIIGFFKEKGKQKLGDTLTNYIFFQLSGIFNNKS